MHPVISALSRPLAIAMWDFSWLERRWPGAGYEDWGQSLNELVERGYNAVRIDAYPHLVAENPTGEWDLVPCWSVLEWGAPCRTKVTVLPHLVEFLKECRKRDIKVGLSTWFREDTTNARLKISSPERHAEIWIATLEHLKREAVLDAVVYVDLCNEWPLNLWAPFFQNDGADSADWRTAKSIAWMRSASIGVKTAFPEIPLTFSMITADGIHPPETGFDDVVDFFEPHLWMAQQRGFYKELNYDYPKFEAQGLERIAREGEALYRKDPAYWNAGLIDIMDRYIALSKRTGRPLATTECWALVDFRDWPGMDWGYLKEICEMGTLYAVSSGCWWAIATSNFCGPQFPGMWRDVAWHRKLTDRIRGQIFR